METVTAGTVPARVQTRQKTLALRKDSGCVGCYIPNQETIAVDAHRERENSVFSNGTSLHACNVNLTPGLAVEQK